MSSSGLALIAGNGNRELANDISRILSLPLTHAQVGRYPDGECDVKVLEDIRNKDIFLIQSTCPPVNENLMELLTLVDCCKRSSVKRITAVIPYFGYARKDRKDEGRVPITAKLVADMMATAGVNRVLALDLHAAQIQGFFDVPVDHLYAKPVFKQRFANMNPESTVVVAPDAGGIKLARAYAQTLKMHFAIVDKRRMGPDETSSEHLIGNVDQMDVILVDDMISTGGTITNAARMVRDKGAKRVTIAATHGLFCGPALERIVAAEVEAVCVTDSVRPLTDYPPVIEVLSVAPLLAEAIIRIHTNRSISSLFVE